MWQFNGKQLEETEIPDKAVGFIYVITQKSTGKRYIGKKLLTKAATKTINGKKKKIRKESDWKDYWSSSPFLKDYITEHGTDDFTKEILVFCQGKGSMVYAEEMALYMTGALETNMWFNDNIRSKVYRSWVKPDEASQLRNAMRTLSLLP
jgi:hypothetical protein